MNDGDEFKEYLDKIEKLAEKFELQLPHVSDSIYSLVKLVRLYDEHIYNFSNIVVKQSKDIKYLVEMNTYMLKFLTQRQIKKMYRHMKKWKRK